MAELPNVRGDPSARGADPNADMRRYVRKELEKFATTMMTLIQHVTNQQTEELRVFNRM
jgi:hypothetical protein